MTASRDATGRSDASLTVGRGQLSGYLLLGAITLFWGINWPAMKIAVTALPPWDFRFACLLTGGLGILLISKAAGQRLRVPLPEIRPLLICSFFNVIGWHVATAYGVGLMEAGRASIIAFTMPVWASLLSVWVLHERLTATRIVALALGLAALGILILPDTEALQRAPIGAIFMLAAAVFWATGTVLMKRYRWSISAGVLAGWQLTAAVPVVLLGAVTIGANESWTAVWTWQQLVAVAYAVSIPMVFCHWAWFQVVRIFPAPIAAIGTLAIPVLGVFSSALLLGERVGLSEISALALVIAALSVVLLLPAWRGHRSARR